jgi:hypothetical protein
MVHHLDTTSIAEIVVRLVGAEEQTGMYLAPPQVGLRSSAACGKGTDVVIPSRVCDRHGVGARASLMKRCRFDD